MKNKILKIKREGFTLIETLVAITILILSIIGPLQIAANSLQSSYYSRDQITAYYLASEAIEYIKNARDTTFLNDVFNPVTTGNNDWLLGLSNCINDGIDFHGCYVDALESFSGGNGVHKCSDYGTVCPPIKYDETSGLWGYSNGVDSKYVRTIEIIPQDGGQEADIRVKVEWPSISILGGMKSFELTGLMMNWERK
jgi:prepilin-type N-terminal cleavage/methylation domain-containing protein